MLTDWLFVVDTVQLPVIPSEKLSPKGQVAAASSSLIKMIGFEAHKAGIRERTAAGDLGPALIGG